MYILTFSMERIRAIKYTVISNLEISQMLLPCALAFRYFRLIANSRLIHNLNHVQNV